MEDLIIYLIVAGAFLYLARWLFKNFVHSKPAETSCSSCDSCETSADVPAHPARRTP